MTSYTNVFTGNPVQVSPTNFRQFSVSVNTALSWPLINEDNANTTADVMEVTATTTGLALLMPPANQVSNGKSCIINNIGANSINIQDSAGNAICTVAAGQVWWVYIRNNANASGAGTWNSFQYGASTSAANAAALAGNGLVAISSLLNVALPINPINSTYTFMANDRATLALWGGGTGAWSLPTGGTLGNNWFVQVKNGGTGSLVITPTGSTIDGTSSLSLNPNASCIIVCDGTNYWTVGLGSSALTTFTRLVLSVAGSSNVTLSSSQAAYNIQEYTGTLTGNIEVIFPAAVGYWFVYNNTNGAFSLTAQTGGGTGVVIPQGLRRIIHCDGTNIVFSDNAGTGTVTQINAGTGLTGGPITNTGTLAIANTTVSPGTYGGLTSIPTLTINAQGQITGASNNTISLGAAASENLGNNIVDDGSGNLSIKSNANLPGSPTTTTQTAGDSSTKIATTAFVNNTALTLANGSTAVTQAQNDNSTKLATTAYVDRVGVNGTKYSSILGGDVTLTNQNQFYDIVSISQGTTGTFLVGVWATMTGSGLHGDQLYCKLWDGTTVFWDGVLQLTATVSISYASLSSPLIIITNPASNLKLSIEDTTGAGTRPIIKANATGLGNDTGINAIRLF